LSKIRSEPLNGNLRLFFVPAEMRRKSGYIRATTVEAKTETDEFLIALESILDDKARTGYFSAPAGLFDWASTF
jgi:hypothetical protein